MKHGESSRRQNKTSGARLAADAPPKFTIAGKRVIPSTACPSPSLAALTAPAAVDAEAAAEAEAAADALPAAAAVADVPAPGVAGLALAVGHAVVSGPQAAFVAAVAFAVYAGRQL